MVVPNTVEKFYVSYKGEQVSIEIHSLSGQTIYRVLIPNMAQLVLHRAQKSAGGYFWTSIPEGKQKLAEAIGPLIEEHIKSNS